MTVLSPKHLILRYCLTRLLCENWWFEFDRDLLTLSLTATLVFQNLLAQAQPFLLLKHALAI